MDECIRDTLTFDIQTGVSGESIYRPSDWQMTRSTPLSNSCPPTAACAAKTVMLREGSGSHFEVEFQGGASSRLRLWAEFLLPGFSLPCLWLIIQSARSIYGPAGAPTLDLIIVTIMVAVRPSLLLAFIFSPVIVFLYAEELN